MRTARTTNVIGGAVDGPWCRAKTPESVGFLSLIACVATILLVACVSLSSLSWAKGLPGTKRGGSDAEIDFVVSAVLDAQSPEQADAVLAHLTDKQVREVLHRVTGELARQRKRAIRVRDANVIEEVATAVSRVGQAWSGLPASLRKRATEMRESGPDIWSRLRPGGILTCATTALLLFWLARRWRHRVAAASPTVGALLGAEVVGAVAFVAGWLLARWLQEPYEALASVLQSASLVAAMMILVPVVATHAFLRRGPGGVRLITLEDQPARDVLLVVTLVTGLIAAIFLAAQTLLAIGISREPVVLLGFSLTPLIWICLGWLGWRYRASGATAVSYTLAGKSRRREVVARAWLPGLFLLLAVVWVLAFVSGVRGETGLAPKVLLTFALPALVVALGALARRAVDRAVTRATAGVAPTATLVSDEAVASPVAAPPAPDAEPLMRAVWLVLGLGAVAAIGYLWGLRPAQFGLGGKVLVVLSELVGLVLIGYIVWGLIGFWVLMLQARLVQGKGSPHAQRYMTLLPLFRKFLQVVVFTLGVMIGLSAIGFDIGPLLASAGVIGIAIGLGAQSTISDILSGVFFLIDDAFHIGDYVEVGNIRGTVEGISLRSMRLRHHRGAIHILPFGQIKSLTNTSRDWMLIRLEFRIASDSDLQKIKKIVKTIGTELQNDPQFAGEFLVPVKSQGVRRIEDNALVIGIKYIAKPTPKVWMIRREVFERVRDSFLAAGIRLVGREVSVRVDQRDNSMAQFGGAATQAAGPPA